MVVAGALAARSFSDKAASIRKAIESQTQSDTGKWTMICSVASIVVMVAGSFKASTAVDGYVGCVCACVVGGLHILYNSSNNTATATTTTSNTNSCLRMRRRLLLLSVLVL